jgi:hypothetical protein
LTQNLISGKFIKSKFKWQFKKGGIVIYLLIVAFVLLAIILIWGLRTRPTKPIVLVITRAPLPPITEKTVLCPECAKESKTGRLRVFEHVVCSCGHHMLVCDNCFKTFGVKCGEPFGDTKLPPKYEITHQADFDETRNSINARCSAKQVASNNAGFENLVLNSPLVEEFAEKLVVQGS